MFLLRAHSPIHKDIRDFAKTGADYFGKKLKMKIAGRGLPENLTLLALNFLIEPGLGVRPVLFDSAFRQPKNLGGFFDGHSNKEAQFDNLGLDRIARGQLIERIIDGQKMIFVGRHGNVHVFKIHSLQTTAVTARKSAPGVVNKKMAHGLGRGGEEMRAIFESRVFFADQAHPDLMHQGGGLERVTGRIMGHFVSGELAQFRIDQRQELIGGFRIAVLDGLKNAGHVTQ